MSAPRTKPRAVRLLPSVRQTLVWLGPAYRARQITASIAAGALLIGLIAGRDSALGPLALAVGVGLLLLGATWLYLALHFADAHIRATVGDPRGWKVHSKIYPLYKFVDIHRAAQRYAAQRPGSAELGSDHTLPLGVILHGTGRAADRRLNTAGVVPRKVGYEDEAYLPTDMFWLIPPPPGERQRAAVIRVRFIGRNSVVQVEAAAPLADAAKQLLDDIAALASQHSIYRNRLIRVVFGPEARSDYGDDESLTPIDLSFYQETPIADDEIVLDERMRGVIQRTILDFHHQRERLRQLGLPGKRGVLFYGPPGTGKTYTCKYIAARLPGATTIVVTGHALLQMKAVCAIARMLQPALVLLEDVDLVFANREQNAYNTVLGEFIDQLDGFGETDQIIFILTTNALERIESAIKDRPGRVSQCIYFGAPSETLRLRYLETLVRPYDAAAVSLARLVAQTEGVSQAFLKELVFRAVQLAAGQAGPPGAALSLTDEHFATALHDITSGGGRAAQRIIGFRMDADR